MVQTGKEYNSSYVLYILLNVALGHLYAISLNLKKTDDGLINRTTFSIKKLHLVEVVDKLSTIAVVFFRSERILKCKCLYGA